MRTLRLKQKELHISTEPYLEKLRVGGGVYQLIILKPHVSKWMMGGGKKFSPLEFVDKRQVREKG